MIHGKSIHYPSGYPMTRSPPFLVSNSPGPDPYRSNDNVYEELGPSRDSDGESEPPMHSDDDFAEDELSLPGERSFNKPSDSNNATQTAAAANTASNANGPERHSVMSSASSTQDASTATAASSSSSHNNNTNTNNGNEATTTTTSRSGAAALISGMLRHTTGRKATALAIRSKNDRRNPSADDLNTSTSTAEVGDLTPMQQMYDNTSNLMALGYQQQQQQPQQTPLNYPQPQSYHHSLHHMHHHNNIRNANVHHVPHFYNTIESEVERRNRINAQLKNPSSPAVATIFRERIQYPGSGRYAQQYYAANAPNGLLANSMRSRTNPRSMDRRRGRVAAPLDPVEPAYGYTEPVYHHNYHYESCNIPNGVQQRVPQPMAAYPTYIMPDYSSGSLSSYRQHHHHHPASQTYQNSSSLYGHGDSSFGSDSGYSHHTPASSIGRHDYDIAMPIPPAPPAPTQKPPSKLANALSFSWNRKKSANSNSVNIQMNTNKTPALSTTTPTTEASSPNNNSGSSTITSTLENTSSSSSAGLQTQNNNELIET